MAYSMPGQQIIRGLELASKADGLIFLFFYSSCCESLLMGSTVALQGWGPGFESDLGPQLHVLPGFLWFPPELKKHTGRLIGFLWIWPQVSYWALGADVRDCNLCIGARSVLYMGS